MQMKDQVVLITGSTDGVGRRVAERLAAQGATVLIHGRDAARATSLQSMIKRAGGTAEVYLADLSSLDEVRSLASAVRHHHQRLDLLINNAGIGVGRPGALRELSQDGYERRFAVNYLAGFLLTRLLLAPLVESRGRIVNVASIGQQAIDFSDPMLTRSYHGGGAYCQSKLAQIMLTFDLAQELESSGVTVNALHPATYMDTSMVRHDGIRALSSIDQGATAIVHLAASAELAGKTGFYFDGLTLSQAHPQAYDTAVRKRLRALSFELTGLAPPTTSSSLRKI